MPSPADELPPFIALPAEDVVLADGRRLHRLRRNGIPHANWRCPRTQLQVLASHHPYIGDGPAEQLHVSLSYPKRLPGWPDLKLVKDAFYGVEGAAMIVLPPAAQYVNIHPYCHHLWQLPVAWHIGKDGLL